MTRRCLKKKAGDYKVKEKERKRGRQHGRVRESEREMKGEGVCVYLLVRRVRAMEAGLLYVHCAGTYYYTLGETLGHGSFDKVKSTKHELKCQSRS